MSGEPKHSTAVGAELLEAGSRPRSRAERTLAGRLVVGVGILYLIVQLITCTVSRAPGWDESVYLSQVSPGMEAMPWDAWRSRGITLLVAPVTWLGGSLRDVRLFLVIASAVAITATFLVWVSLVGLAAPLAALAFALSWLALVYGAEVMPNLWAAILGLAAAGLIVRRLEGGSPRHTVLATAALCGMALVRPTEAAVLACLIGAWVLIFHRSSWRVLALFGSGLALGWLPWFIEMSARFGGPIPALREAANEHFATASVAENVIVNLAQTSGGPSDEVPWGGVVWWTLLVALSTIAILRATPSERRITLLLCLGATVFAAEYLVFVSALAPRFLLPAYGFASLAAATGVISALRGSMAWRSLGVFVLLLLLPWGLWQAAAADRTDEHRTQATAPFPIVGHAIRDLAEGRPCRFIGPRGWPMLQFASGCEASMRDGSRVPTEAELEELLAGGDEVFVILRRLAPRSSSLAGLTPTPVRGVTRTWFIYQVSGR